MMIQGMMAVESRTTRMKNGSYDDDVTSVVSDDGYCCDCGDNISFENLE
jgi:hypothetical protein